MGSSFDSTIKTYDINNAMLKIYLPISRKKYRLGKFSVSILTGVMNNAAIKTGIANDINQSKIIKNSTTTLILQAVVYRRYASLFHGILELCK